MTRAGANWSRLWPLVVAAPSVIAVVVAARLWGMSWTPVGDWAAMWLRADDVFTRHTPLIGAYSTRNWAHPGPSIFWVVWLLKRLSFDSVPRAFALLALLNGATLSATIALARRWFGDAPALVTAFGAVVVAHALGGRELGDFWNPYVPVVWFFAFAVGALAIASGRGGRAWIWTIVFGSLAAQAHLSFLFLVVVFSVTVALGARLSGHRSGSAPAPRSVPRAPLVAIAAVFWLPVLVDLAFGSRNLNRIRQYLTLAHQRLGFADGLHLVARELEPWGPLLRGGQPITIGGVAAASMRWLLPIGSAAIAMAIVAVRRKDARRYVVPALAILLVLPLLAAGLEGVIFAYLVTYVVAATAVFWWLCLLTLVSIEAIRSAVMTITAMGLAALMVLSLSTDPGRAALPVQQWSPVIHVAAAKFRARVGNPHEPIVLDALDDELGLISPGVTGILAAHYDLHTLDSAARLHKWGYARGELPRGPYLAFTIMAMYPQGAGTAANACILAHHPPIVVSTTALSPAEAKEYQKLRVFDFLRGGHVPGPTARRLDHLLDRAARVVIVKGLFRKTC